MCPPVYNQGELGSCTANAISGAIEFDQMKEGLPQIFVPSRLFIYYNERVIEGTVNSDSGAMLRDGIKAVAKQGACPEPMWPYLVARFKTKPSVTCYRRRRSIRLLAINASSNHSRRCKAVWLPVTLLSLVSAFTKASKLTRYARTGHAPMPESGEPVLGGHAVCAVGYDITRRWFICRNSWGTSWGLRGYFTIPFAYLTDIDLAADFWTIRVVQ